MTGRQESFKAVAMTVAAFTACFACWVINSILITALTSWGTFSFSESQVGWLLAAPLLTGALARLPVGLLSDRFGGRQVLIALMVATAIPLFLLSQANSYSGFLMASLGFGLAGGSFAACVAYISTWFEKSRQGTALGMLGLGNVGAAVTTLLAPSLLAVITANGTQTERWRMLPQLFAGALALMAIVFWLTTKDRRAPAVNKTLRSQFESHFDVTVWRFGLYYALTFGSFLALAQWIVPYTLNTYRLSLTQAGLIASVFSLPAGLVRAAGGWLADRFGALTIMYCVFATGVMVCLLLSIPRMDVQSPGEGVAAKAPGVVTSVSSNAIAIGSRTYPLVARPDASSIAGDSNLPSITRWQVPAVELGEKVAREQLIAAGVTRIFYPSSIWLFITLILVLGIAMGVGSAAVYRLIPDQFPASIGLVGGTVGLLGGLGGFIFVPVFGYLLHGTGLWSSCWIVLAALALICLVWMHVVARRVVLQQAPELVQQLEKPPLPGLASVHGAQDNKGTSLEMALKQIPWFADLSSVDLQSIERIGRTCSAAQDEYLFREGDPADSLYLILSGSVDLVRLGADGTEIWLESRSTGEFFGELAIIDGGTRSRTIRAREATELLLIHRRDFLSLVTKSPRMLADFLIGLSGKVRHVNAQYYEAAIQQNKLRVEQDAALEATRLKSEFLANMSHELRTPLNAIIGYSEILAEEAEDLGREDMLGDLKKIRSAGKHLQALIDDILDLSKIEAGKMEVYLETVDVSPMLQDVVSTIAPLVTKNDNRLEVRCAGDLGTIEADLTKVRQALFNLLSNASKFTSNGVITLVAARERVNGVEWIRFGVSDTGIGISPEQMKKLFQAFSQADASTSRKYGGTGLGLILSRRFCQMMGGDIAVDSVQGQGSTFTIQLPVDGVVPKVPASPREEETSIAAATSAQGLPTTVLVIEDDPMARELMRRFLDQQGLHVVEAASGEEGLRLAKELRPAVITLDVLMPGIDGWAVLGALKADPVLASIPVIMATVVDDKNRGFALGATDFLTKPINRADLARVLKKFPCANPPCPVLVVEDQADLRELMRHILEQEGWVVAEAENGCVALDRVAENRPDLIVLDLMMPEMDGFSFLEALHQRAPWRSIPIVVVTAKDLTEEDRQRLNGYVQYIIDKGSYTREELLRELADRIASCMRQVA